MADKEKKPSVSASNRKLLVFGVGILAVVVVLSFAVPSLLAKNKSKAPQADKVIVQVRKILLLPSSSEPTVIEVSDTERLRTTNPEFYKDVENGDYLLMYPGKAIIYRQSSNQIINVAPINSKKD